MMRSLRIEEIKNYIYENKTATLDELCKNFHISKSTLRRDLNTILQPGENSIRKIYGGVTAFPQKSLIPFEERSISNLEAKRKIAKTAVQMIRQNDIIFLDSGTTTLRMMDVMKDKKNITILTNNEEIILHAFPYENLNVISLGGTLSRKTLSFTGPSAVQMLQNCNIGRAFMGTAGFSILNGVTNSSPSESDIKRVVVQRSQKVYLLADGSKCNAAALTTYCGLNQIDTLITDRPPTEEICSLFRRRGNEILIADGQ